MEIATSPRETARPRSETRLWSARSSDLISFATLAVLTAVFSWDRLHDGREVSQLDNITQFIPWYAQLGERLRQGEIPGWLPSIFSGIPFVGDPQSGWMYVPAMGLFTPLEPLTAFKAFVVFHLLLAGISSYVLGRLFGLGPLGSLTTAIVFEFGPFLRYTGCCFAYAEVTAWVPMSLIGVEIASRARTSLVRGGGWVLAGFALSQELAGWLGQGAYYGLLATLTLIVFRTLTVRNDGRPSFWLRIRAFATHCLGVYGFAFGLAAAGMLPRLDSISRSTRAGGVTASSPESFVGWTPYLLIDRLLSLNKFGHWYLGGSVFALSILAAFIGRPRSSIYFFTGYSLFILLLAMGSTPMHDLFFLMPGFEDLHEHVPSRILMVFWIGPAFLAGAAVDSLADLKVDSRRLFWGLAATIGICVGSVASVHLFKREISVQAAQSMVLVIALTLLAAYLVRPATRAALPYTTTALRVVLIVLVMVIVWDTTGRWYGEAVAGRNEDPNPARTISTALDSSPSGGPAVFLRNRESEFGPFRYFGYDPGYLVNDNWGGGYRTHYRKSTVQSMLVLNRAITLGLEDIQGYNPVQIGRYSELFTALNGYPQEYHEANVYPPGISSPILNLLNARYIIVPAKIPPGRPDLLHISQRYPTAYQNRQVRILENSAALDRAWIVHEAQVAESDEALELLSTGQLDPRTTVLLEESPPELGPASNPEAESVTFDELTPDSLRMTATAAAPAMLVVSDAFDPNWKAYVDGEEVELFVADHAFRAVPLPAGTHVVEMRYESLALQVGLGISAIASALALGIATWLGIRFLRGRRGTVSL